ncbi:MAG: acetolactate decarboxylase, partial [Candidatus Theseobacter exili]|nr:acetolactate decarboxylase [Candidatus Theseobacter exili]
MKRIRLLAFIFLAGFFLSGCKTLGVVERQQQSLYQYSTSHALLEGVYYGDLTCGELVKKGNLGLGTFNALDGELICMNGTVYQVKSDGTVSIPKKNEKIPFAAVTFFNPEKVYKMNLKMDYNALKEAIDSKIVNKNSFTALWVQGSFSYVKTRAPVKQQKPYPRLADALKNQQFFEFHNVKGTLVGFRLPEYIKGINVPDFHLHFLTEDKLGG